ncbi:unnamed protein product [Closterium sp. NIES-54]
MVGALNYAANHTRPDIAFATSRLASVVSRPSHEQLEAAKRLVRYVSATASVGLEYSAVRQRLQRGAADLGKGEMLLTCYTDASFNSVKADGTSIGGYVCLFGGGAVSWRSKKQNEVGQSSCETEYMALHHGAKEVLWLRRLLEEIGVCQKEPTVIFCDNESAVKLAKNACIHGLTKHITPKWHWVRRLLDKEVRLEIVKTHQQAADMLTKRLAESEHWKGMKLAGMSSLTHSSSLQLVTAPFRTLHLDVWGPAPCLGPERERYFLVVVDDYSCYTIVFPLAKKSENGVAERRIGLVMEIARTSMIHACAPHFLWPYAVRYAAHQLNICPRVSRPGDSPTSLWTGSPRVALEFHVWGCLALVRNTSADKLSARAIPCVFLGFAVNSPDIAFYDPLLHRFLGSRDIRFDESVSYYVRSPCRGLPPPPPHLFIAPFPPPSPTPLRLPSRSPPHSPLSSLRHFRDRLLGGVGARGAGAGGAGTGGASSRGARAGGAGSGGAISGGAGAGGASTGGVITEETGAGCTNSTMPMPPPHRYDMRLQALRHLEREEQKKLEQERQELQKLDQQE